MTVVTAHLHMLASELRSAPTKAGGVWGNNEPAVRALATHRDQGLSPHVGQLTPAGLLAFTGTWGHRHMHRNI